MEDFKKIYDALSEDLKEKFSRIRFIGLDFDGVFTDNTVFQGEDGIETVKRSKADSLGIDILDESGLYSKENYLEESHGVDLLILSKESNLVISSVGKKIKIKALRSQFDKKTAFRKELKKRNLNYSLACFVGNDLNDLECIQNAGIGIAVADSAIEVLKNADYVTWSLGGKGAVREIIELVLYAKKRHPSN